MKLSESTLRVMRNYAAINSNFMARLSDRIQTNNVDKTLAASAKLSDSFERPFGVSDLGQFLNVIDITGENPELKFEESCVVIMGSDGRTETKYYYANPELLMVSDKDLVDDFDAAITFELDRDTMSQIKKAAAVLNCNEIIFESHDGAVRISTAQANNPTSNAFSITVDAEYPEGAEFRYIAATRRFQLLDEDYAVGIVDNDDQMLIKFNAAESDIFYVMALEHESTRINTKEAQNA